MNAAAIKEHLKMLMELEKEVYTQNQVIASLEYKLSGLPDYRQYVKPVHKARLYRSKLQLPNQWTYMVVLWQRTYIPFVSTCIRCHHQFRLGNYGLASLSYSFNFLPCQVFRYPLCNIFVRRWHNRFLCRKEQSIRRSLCCQTAIQKIL